MIALIKITGIINANKYQNILDNEVIYCIHSFHGDDFIFQQDNASPHKAKDTLDFLKNRKIHLLDWPSKSLDLNPMENIWRLMVRKVYVNGKRYSNVIELWQSIQDSWSSLERY